MADRIRVIPHYPEGIPDCGSFEVWFADGRQSQYFYWDDNPGRASTTRKMNQSQAKEAARNLARAERDKLEHTCSLCDGGPISHGRDRTPAPVARPARHALTATVQMPASRRDCRKASNLMLKSTAPYHGQSWGDYDGRCRAGWPGDRPDEPTAGKPDGSLRFRNPPGP